MGIVGYLLLFIIPFLVGISISDKVLPLIQNASSVGIFGNEHWAFLLKEKPSPSSSNNISKAEDSQKATTTNSSPLLNDPFENVRFVIHRNGEASPCGHTVIPFTEAMVQYNAVVQRTSDGGSSSSSSSSSTKLSLSKESNKFLMNHQMNKYQLDHFLTSVFGKHALPLSSCGVEQVPPDIQGSSRKTWGRGEGYKIDGVDSQFLTFCDMGPDHTTILPDHDLLLEIVSWDSTSANHNNNGGGGAAGGDMVVNTLPCHFHTREGLRFTSYQQLVTYVQQQREKILPQQQENTIERDNEEEQECTILDDDGSSVCHSTTLSEDTIINLVDVHLYAVPAGRPFVFAPSFVGEVFEISHVTPKSEKPISLKVMSVSPRVFDILNFFDVDESDAIVTKALAETSETHRIKRSSTGASGYNLNSQRTSENGFDTHGETAIIVKKRCTEVLGFDEYIESFTDGLQVLRYNKTTAYIPHMDWIDDPHKREVHNYDSAGQGTNRFATILLYMSDLGEGDGGETVFKHAWPLNVPEDQRKSRPEALEELRSSGDASELERDSWQELMVADCRSRLAVRPQSARAVLFYSQHPNGEEDTSSLHGGCPVLHGQKWAANLWVWNGPRGGFPGAPTNPGKEEKAKDNNTYEQIHVTFVNTGKDPIFKEAKLYFQDSFWGDFSHGDPPLSVNTYEGHQWNIRRISDNELLKQIVIPSGKNSYRFEV